jgi:hypothetical protein
MQAELKDRELISLKHAAQTAGIDLRTLCRRMTDNQIPIIRLGPRKRAVLLGDFDRLMAKLAQPVPARVRSEFAFLDQIAGGLNV